MDHKDCIDESFSKTSIPPMKVIVSCSFCGYVAFFYSGTHTCDFRKKHPPLDKEEVKALFEADPSLTARAAYLKLVAKVIDDPNVPDADVNTRALSYSNMDTLKKIRQSVLKAQGHLQRSSKGLSLRKSLETKQIKYCSRLQDNYAFQVTDDNVIFICSKERIMMAKQLVQGTIEEWEQEAISIGMHFKIVYVTQFS